VAFGAATRPQLPRVVGPDVALRRLSQHPISSPLARDTQSSIVAGLLCHLIVVLLALSVVGDRQGATPLWLDVALIAGTFIVLYTTACWFASPGANLSAADSTKRGRLLTVRAAR